MLWLSFVFTALAIVTISTQVDQLYVLESILALDIATSHVDQSQATGRKYSKELH